MSYVNKIYSKYLLSLFASIIGACASFANSSSDYINDGSSAIAIASTGPNGCLTQFFLTICTLGVNTGIIIFDSYSGAQHRIPGEIKRSNRSPDLQ